MLCLIILMLTSSFLSEKFDIQPSRMRMLKLFVVLSGALHLGACFFWRVKVCEVCLLWTENVAGAIIMCRHCRVTNFLAAWKYNRPGTPDLPQWKSNPTWCKATSNNCLNAPKIGCFYMYISNEPAANEFFFQVISVVWERSSYVTPCHKWIEVKIWECRTLCKSTFAASISSQLSWSRLDLVSSTRFHTAKHLPCFTSKYGHRSIRFTYMLFMLFIKITVKFSIEHKEG